MLKLSTKKINQLRRIGLEQINESFEEDVLLLPSDVDVAINSKNNVVTIGLGNLDDKQKDLLRLVKIKDATEACIEKTHILSPRTYAESLQGIFPHISVQCLFFSEIDENTAQFINSMNKKKIYGKTDYDKLIVSDSKYEVRKNDLIYIMNRRVGGWDGSELRPVIELLCAGGHLPSVFNKTTDKFDEPSFSENLQREIKEELKIDISKNQVMTFGGFYNNVSNELVVVCGLMLDSSKFIQVFKNAYGNVKENIDGIYVGYIDEIMQLYNKFPNWFAGGEKAKSTNFLSQFELMQKVINFVR